MEVPILSNLGSKSEGVKKTTEGAEGQAKNFAQVFELIMSKDLVTAENGLGLAMAEDLEAELPAEAAWAEETDPGQDGQEAEQQFITILPSIFSPGILANPKTALAEFEVETEEQEAQTLGETLDQALDQALGDPLGEAIDQALGEATAQAPDQAPAQAPDQTDAKKDVVKDDKKTDTANIAPSPQLVSAQMQAGVEQPETQDDAALAIDSDNPDSKNKTERLWGHWVRSRGGSEGKTSGNQQQKGFKEIMSGMARDNDAEKTLHSDSQASKADKSPSDLKTLDLKEAAPGWRQEISKAQATQQPKEAPGLKPARQPSPSAQVSNAVKILINKGEERMTVRLEPESLGKVEIVLSRDHAGVTASFKVETPQAQQAIAADAAALKNALAAKGVPVVQVVVDMKDGRDSRESAAQGNKHGKKRRGIGAVGASEDGDDFPSSRQTAWRPWGFDALI